MTLPIFNPSVSGMNAQSHALGQISTNIANVNTPGYKRAETMFQDLLSRTSVTGNFLTVQTVDRRNVEAIGLMQSTEGVYDLALNGSGFFMLNENSDGTGNEYYTRAGNFIGLANPVGDGTIETYLGTTGGQYVLGWNADEQGVITPSTTPEPVRLDAATLLDGTATTTASIRANIRSDSDDGHETIGVPIYDNVFDGQTLSLNFDREVGQGIWNLSFQVSGGTVDVDPLNPNVPVRFDSVGRVAEPAAEIPVTINWDDGSTSTVNIDISRVTQLSGPKVVYEVDQDGYANGTLKTTSFNDMGIMSATYSNGRTIPLFQIAQADFTVPDKLEAVSFNMFRYTGDAGEKLVLGVDGDAAAQTRVLVNTVELSNVDIGEQFTKMIVTQRAYSGSATAFKTSDELMQQATALKT